MKLIINSRLACLAFFVFVMSVSTKTFAIVDTIGTKYTASGAYTGVCANYKISSAEFALSPGEIDSIGMITEFALFKDSSSAGSAIDSVTIYMRESNKPITAKCTISEYTKVYSGTIPNGMAMGWANVVLDSAFHYEGKENLRIFIVRKSSIKITTNPPKYFVSYKAAKAYQAAYYFSDYPSSKVSGEYSQNVYEHYRPYVRLKID